MARFDYARALSAPTKETPTMDAKTDLTKHDLDPTETQVWLDALAAVIGADGLERAFFAGTHD
jgi:hypothetical protein